MKMRKVYRGLITLLISITLLEIVQCLRFPIESNNSNVQILDWMDLGNRRYVSILLDGRLGEANLIKGLNGRFN